MNLTRLGAAAIAAGGLVLSGCATGGSGAGESLDVAELERLYRARSDSALARFTEADVRFVTGMITHHGQAIEMAEMAPDRAESGSVHTLAARILNAQRDEIALMERWLQDRGQAMPAHDAMDHAGHLPGMLSDADLEDLRRASGPAFDRLFLTYMIRHHRGAVAMVEELLAADAAVQGPATFKLASDIHVDQSTEIARMERMLDTLNGGGAG